MATNWIPIPSFLRSFYSYFPLHYNPSIPPPSISPLSTKPVLWITPPLQSGSSTVLSKDVECLKWQAYIALRGIKDVHVRWDIDPSGGVDGKLPSLWIPPKPRRSESYPSQGEVLSSRMIPGWADEIQGDHAWSSDLEGYNDDQAKDESRAWVSLLESAVHATLISCQSQAPFLLTWLYSMPSHTMQLTTILAPPLAPLTGFSTLIPPQGVNVPVAALQSKCHDAIAAISERLGTDKWLLGSSEPTPLDALLFAYLHVILHPLAKGQDRARAEVTRHVNLVAWERKVRSIVHGAFQPLRPQL